MIETFRGRILEPAVKLAAACLAGAALVSSSPAWAVDLSPLTTVRTVEVDSGGMVLRTSYNPIAIFLLSVILLVCAAGVFWALLSFYRTTAGGHSLASLPKSAPAATKAVLDKQISKVLGLVRGLLQSNETFRASLASAQDRLDGLKDPTQVGVVIGILVSENERMRREAVELKSRLEESRSEIEALQASLTEAQEIGLIDPLTKVGNRRHFDLTLEKAVAEAVTTKTPLCLVMSDIDNFKYVNDTFGHTVGDEVLKMFARLLADNVRDGDTVARFGGEEFAVVLPRTAQESATSLAERVRRQCESRQLKVRTTNEPMGKLTASFGVAQLREGETPDMLVERADAKLYEAKCTGRNRVAVYGNRKTGS